MFGSAEIRPIKPVISAIIVWMTVYPSYVLFHDVFTMPFSIKRLPMKSEYE